MNNSLYKIETVCSVLAEQDVEEAVACISRTFSQGEPMTSLLNISHQDFTYFARIFIEKAAKEGLSVIARDAVNNQLIGAVICEDYVTDLPEGVENISPLFNPILELLEKLGADYRAKYQIQAGEIFHLFMGGVYKEYAGYGIAAQMTEFIEKIAREKGYKGAVGEVTGPISQHVYINHLGFQPLYEVSYADFIFEGKNIFQEITACESCVLIHKPL